MEVDTKYKYALELIVQYPSTIEQRCLRILKYLNNEHPSSVCIITNLEATGSKGVLLSESVENENEIPITIDQIIEVFQEDGQVIELNLLLEDKSINLWIQIVDGTHVNIISNDYSLIKENILGVFNYLDLGLFRY